MSTREEVADVLDRTADALWMYGRCKGSGIALAQTEGCDPEQWVGRRSDAYEALRSYVASHPDAHADANEYEWVGIALKGSPFVWNDRTKDDALIIDSLRRCAKEQREEAGQQ